MSRISLLKFCLMGVMTLIFAACETTNTNSNTANTRNTNQGVLTSNGNANNTNANANNSNREITKDEVNKDIERYKREAKEAGRKIGEGAEDTWLWVKTRASLAAVDDLRDSTINVDVENNVVTLSGTVGSAAQKAAAEKTAKEIEGVKSVKNLLKVSASGDVKATPTPKSK